MRLLKHVDYKLKVHLMINTSSMLEFQLRKHNKSCIGTTWRDLIMKAEVFDRSAELSIVTGSNLDPEKYWHVQTKSYCKIRPNAFAKNTTANKVCSFNAR